MNSEKYQSLADPHLNAYFNNKRIRRHLIKAGLINRRGEILPPPKHDAIFARRAKRRQSREKLADFVASYVIDEHRKHQAFIRDQFDFAMKRYRVQQMRESRAPHRSMLTNIIHVSRSPKRRRARTPSPTTRKQVPKRAKSAVYLSPPRVTNQAIRRPATSKRSSKDEFCDVTMIYYGPQLTLDHKTNWLYPNGDEIVVMQQHCGGENLQVFKGFVKPNELFKFESRRHPDYPFAIAIYINGLIDSRVSVCCEYKHRPNVRLGSKHGLFGIYSVDKSSPCRTCRFEKRLKQTSPRSPIVPNAESYRRSVVLRKKALDQTQSSTSEGEETSSKPTIDARSTTPSTNSKTNANESIDNELPNDYKFLSKILTPIPNDETKPANLLLRRQESDDTSTHSQKSSFSSRQSTPKLNDNKISARSESHASKKSLQDPSYGLFNNDESNNLGKSEFTRETSASSLKSSRKSSSSSETATEDEDKNALLKFLLAKPDEDNESTRTSSSSSKTSTKDSQGSLSRKEDSPDSFAKLLQQQGKDSTDTSATSSRKSSTSSKSATDIENNDFTTKESTPKVDEDEKVTSSGLIASRKSSQHSSNGSLKDEESDNSYIRMFKPKHQTDELSKHSRKSSSSSESSTATDHSESISGKSPQKANRDETSRRSASSASKTSSQYSSNGSNKDEESDNSYLRMFKPKDTTDKSSKHSRKSSSASKSSTVNEYHESTTKTSLPKATVIKEPARASPSDLFKKEESPQPLKQPFMRRESDDSTSKSSKSSLSLSSSATEGEDYPFLSKVLGSKVGDEKSTPRSRSNASKKSGQDSPTSSFKKEDSSQPLKPFFRRRESDESTTKSSRKSSASSLSSAKLKDGHSLPKILSPKPKNIEEISRSSSRASERSAQSASADTLKHEDSHDSFANRFEREDNDENLSIVSPKSADSHPSPKPITTNNDFNDQRYSRSSSSSSTFTDSSNEDILTADNKPLESDSMPKLSDAIPEPATKQRSDNQDQQPTTTTPDKRTVRQYRPMENIAVLWLDASSDKIDDDINNSKTQLRQVARIIRTFTTTEKCIQFINEIRNEKVFLIASGHLSEDILSQIKTYTQIAVAYIYCQNKNKYEYLTNKYDKVKGIYTDIKTICEHLKHDSKQWDNDLNTFQTTSMIQRLPLTPDQLSFVHNQLFKEYLLEVKYDDDAINDLAKYCKSFYEQNKNESEIIQEFKANYTPNNALHWYTRDCFAYYLLNRAIRMKDIGMLFQMGFFIRDINQQLEENSSQTTNKTELTLFRGQGVKQEYFEELQRNQGGLISFNGFLSTSSKHDVAYDFAQRSLKNGFPIAVLFRIKIVPQNSSYPYVSLEKLSSHQSEHEILFSLKAIFQIDAMAQVEDNIWEVNLTVIDEKQHGVSSYLQIESKKFNQFNDYDKLGQLLIQMNELSKAKYLYEMNVPSISDPTYTQVYNQLASICTDLNDYNQAHLYYTLALGTKSIATLTDYVTISNIHNQIGKLFYKQGKFSEAYEKFQYALDLQLKHLSATHPALTNTYDLLGMISEENGDYQQAVEYYEKKLDIHVQNGPKSQSDIAFTHHKMALCFEKLDRFNEANYHIQEAISKTRPNDPALGNRQAVLKRIQEALE